MAIDKIMMISGSAVVSDARARTMTRILLSDISTQLSQLRESRNRSNERSITHEWKSEHRLTDS